MATVGQVLKSKTVNFNVLMPLVLEVIKLFDITVSPELTAGILALGNIVLRFLTNKAINEK